MAFGLSSINIERMEQHRDIDGLARALGDRDVSIRRHAARVLGKAGDPRAIGPLMKALYDADKKVCKEAAYALDRLGWETDEHEMIARYWIVKGRWDMCVHIGAPATRPLISAMNDADSSVRESAAESIMKLGDAAVEGLIKALAETPDEAFGCIEDPRLVKPLIDLLDYPSNNVREHASKILSRIRWDRLKDISSLAAIAFIGSLDDPDCKVRCNAAFVLGMIADPIAVEPLIKALYDVDHSVRANAATSLGKIRDLRALEPLMVMLDDNYPDMCIVAADSLGTIGDPRAVDALIGKLSDPHVKYAAARALGIIGDSRAVEPLVDIINKPWQGDTMYCFAIGALQMIGDPRAIVSLKKLAYEYENIMFSNPRYVKGKALDAIGKLSALQATSSPPLAA